jgi:hypothetical protein
MSEDQVISPDGPEDEFEWKKGMDKFMEKYFEFLPVGKCPIGKEWSNIDRIRREAFTNDESYEYVQWLIYSFDRFVSWCFMRGTFPEMTNFIDLQEPGKLSMDDFDNATLALMTLFMRNPLRILLAEEAERRHQIAKLKLQESPDTGSPEWYQFFTELAQPPSEWKIPDSREFIGMNEAGVPKLLPQEYWEQFLPDPLELFHVAALIQTTEKNIRNIVNRETVKNFPARITKPGFRTNYVWKWKKEPFLTFVLENYGHLYD